MIDSELTQITLWTVANLVVFFATLGINYLGSSGFSNGMGQAEVSKKYRTLITPDNFAFAIWGVIYTLVFATLIYYFVQRKDPAVSQLIQLTSGLFILSSLFNMGWIIAFSYEKLGLSTVLIFGLLFSLMTIIERIYIGQATFPTTLACIAFTLYAAWVFIASILNVSLFLVQRKWKKFGLSDSIWTIAILFVAIIFVLFYVSIYRNAIFPLPLAWAFYGIYSSYKKGKINPTMKSVIQMVLIFGMVVYLGLSGYIFITNGYAIFPVIN